MKTIPTNDLRDALLELTGEAPLSFPATAVGPGIVYLLKYPDLEIASLGEVENAFPPSFYRLLAAAPSWPELLPDSEKQAYLQDTNEKTFLPTIRYTALANRRGQTIPVVDYRELVRDSNGTPVALLGRLVDDSFRSTAFDSLARRSWKEIATNMTRRYLHDFNNTIAGIYSLSELFAEPGSDPKSTAEAMGHIRDSSIRAQDLTRKIRVLTTLENGEVGYHDLKTLLEEQLDFMQALLPKGAAIRLSLDAQEYPIRIDPNLFKQVVLHLASNAYDACGDDIELEIRLIETSGNGERLCALELMDNGRGFSEEELAKGTLPFFTTKDSDKHPGLGLSIAADLVKKLGGSIELANGETGALVRLRLPLLEQEAQKISPASSSPKPATAPRKNNPPAPADKASSPPNLLIYTWEDISRHPLLAAMKKAGWQTSIHHEPADLILDLAAENDANGVIVFRSALDDRVEPLISELGRARNCKRVALLALEANVDTVSPSSKAVCGFVASSSTRPSTLLKDLNAFFSK